MQTLLFKISLLMFGLSLLGDIYSIRVATFNGADKPLSIFKGKKLMVVVLPTTETSEDTAFVTRINNLSKTYSSKLSVLAVPSFEDGYRASKSSELRSFYNTLLGQQVTITEGMFTHRSSPAQHDLFAFLTHVGRNLHFDMDVEGARQSFLVDEQGQLFAVISPTANLTDKMMQKMLQ